MLSDHKKQNRSPDPEALLSFTKRASPLTRSLELTPLVSVGRFWKGTQLVAPLLAVTVHADEVMLELELTLLERLDDRLELDTLELLLEEVEEALLDAEEFALEVEVELADKLELAEDVLLDTVVELLPPPVPDEDFAASPPPEQADIIKHPISSNARQ